MERIDLVQEGGGWTAVVNTVMNLHVPYNFGKVLRSCMTSRFSEMAQIYGVRRSMFDWRKAVERLGIIKVRGFLGQVDHFKRLKNS
jgi:hypothetical protein